MRMTDEDEFVLKEKPDVRYIKYYLDMRPATRECGQTKDLIPNCMSLLGTANLGMGSGCHSLKGRLNLYTGTPPTTRLLVVPSPALHPGS